MNEYKYILFIILNLILSPLTGFAAPCCSGSAIFPSLITTDSDAQISVKSAQSSVVGSSGSDGSSVFRRNGNDENQWLFQLSGAYALSPRWQIHTEIPMTRRYRAIDDVRSNHFGLSDISVGGSFEAIEELLYQPLKPRVWLFADVSAPTGKSIFDSSDKLQVDAHGRGAYSGTLGFFAQKIFRNWDVFFMGEHRRFLKQNKRSPGALSTLDIGGGYSWGDFRLGTSLGPTWEAKSVGDTISSQAKLVWNVSIQASYATSEDWAFSLAYSDQTLVGPTYNATLSRSASLSLTRRFN